MNVLPVLYAEDDPNDAFFMCRAWELSGCPNPVIVLKDGQQAIDYLAGHNAFADRQKYPVPGLVLLDLKLPVKGGFDVLRWIHQNSITPPPKVVIVSASDQESDIALAQSLGAVDYLIKPSSPVLLEEIIRERKKLWLNSGSGD